MKAVGAQRFGFENLPLIFVASEFNLLLIRVQANTAEFVWLDCEQALVTQIIQVLVDTALCVARNREYSRIILKLQIGCAPGWGVVSNQHLMYVVAFSGHRHFDCRRT